MIKYFLAFILFVSFEATVFCQVPDNAQRLYDKGVVAFNMRSYNLADSLFSQALNLYTWPDLYYNKAMVGFKLNDMKSYCLNLSYASNIGDSESKQKYKDKCITTDTIYRNVDSLVCLKDSAYMQEVISVEPFLYKMNYTKYYGDSVIVSYEIHKRDTIYFDCLNKILPVYPGGDDGMMKYLKENIRYPRFAKENGTQGTVYVQFEVDEIGNVGETKILRGPSNDLNLEVIRVVKAMPKWTPGYCDGEIAKLLMIMPVRFSLK